MGRLPAASRRHTLIRLFVLSALVLLAAATRLAPHPPNFTPVGAMALFAGACVADRRLAVALPLMALLLSDLAIGLHVLMPVVYASFALNVLLGRWLRRRRRLLTTGGATLAGSVQFFVTTNFVCWLLFYPHTAAGLGTCYAMALPYFQNTLLGDFTFAAILFGGLSAIERGFPAVREPIATHCAADKLVPEKVS